MNVMEDDFKVTLKSDRKIVLLKSWIFWVSRGRKNILSLNHLINQTLLPSHPLPPPPLASPLLFHPGPFSSPLPTPPSFYLSVSLPLSLLLFSQVVHFILTFFLCVGKKMSSGNSDIHHVSFLELVIPEGKTKRFALPIHQFHFSEGSNWLCFPDISLSRCESLRLNSPCREVEQG